MATMLLKGKHNINETWLLRGLMLWLLLFCRENLAFSSPWLGTANHRKTTHKF